MTRTTKKVLVAALMCSALGCEDEPSSEEGSRTAASSTPDAGPPGQCRELDDGQVVVTTSLQTRRGATLTYTQTFVPMESAWGLTAELTLDGALLQRNAYAGAGENLELRVDYGEGVEGVRVARGWVHGDTFVGEIDGAPTAEVPLDELDVRTLTMADGSPLPRAAYPSDVQEVFPQLLENAEAIANACGMSRPDATGSTIAQRTPISGGTGVPGHDSDPENSWECGGCWTGCSVGAGLCIGGVSAGCAAFGPFYVVCEIAGVAACGIAYLVCIDACYYPGPCCPIQCGDVACCEDGETCLNGQVGLCCSPGLNACGGKSCCEPSDTCIDSGPNAGTCCRSSNVCGDACCGDLDSCVAHLSLCCPFGSPACGDRCCESGSACLHGDECCPSDRACGDTCCPEGSSCDPETLDCVTCPDRGTFCPEAGACCPAGTYCSPVPGVCCAEGEYYCDGACRPTSSCI